MGSILGGKDVLLFQELSPRLLGLAYRILGSWADAEDAVQDTFLRWQDADRAAIDHAPAWLTTACTRRCIDMLRSFSRSRVDYIGPWLPEPMHTKTDPFAHESPRLASSLSTAFLLMLERLTPRERGAYLLHEIFELSYSETAQILGIQQSTCRKLISRARASVGREGVRHVTPMDRQEQLLAAFKSASLDGNTDRLGALLAEDAELRVDSGGRVPAIQRILRGKGEVLAFLQQARPWWTPCEWLVAELNGARAIVLRKDGSPTAAISFAYDDAGEVIGIYLVRNPEKLARVDIRNMRHAGGGAGQAGERIEARTG
jgi:RNA polymerase sigma-70 factor (ECF subfamily)